MGTRRLELLIREARDQTGNKTSTSTTGIPTREFVRHFNNGQERIHSRIMQERPSVLLKEGFLSTTSGTASYTLPTDILLKHNVLGVDYSYDGAARNFFPLGLRSLRNRDGNTGDPISYSVRDGSLLLSPIPNRSVTNGLRINYQKTIPRLDVRRGQVTSTNFSSGALTVTSIVLDDDTWLTTDTTNDFSNSLVDYFCIVDKDGAQLCKDIPFTSYDSTTRTITCGAGFTAEAGSTLPVGAFLVFGKNASTHSTLDESVERYLVEYCTLRIQSRDASKNVTEQSQVLRALEQDILDAYANLEEDLFEIPIINSEWAP